MFYWILILKNSKELTGMHQVESRFCNDTGHYQGHIYDTAKHLLSSFSAKIVNRQKPLIIFVKGSVIYICHCPKYASDY